MLQTFLETVSHSTLSIESCSVIFKIWLKHLDVPKYWHKRKVYWCKASKKVLKQFNIFVVVLGEK